MKEVLLGIDIGGGGIKVGSFDLEGNLIGLVSEPLDNIFPHPGWAESETRHWLERLSACMKNLLSALDGHSITGIGFSNMCPSLVAMDAEGNPLRPAILYLDTRSFREAAFIQEKAPLEWFLEESGNRVAPGTISGTTMRWIKDNEPEVYDSAAIFGHANTFLAMALTGNAGMDYSNASLTGLFDQGRKRSWSPALCEVYGVDIKKLPKLIQSHEMVGRLNDRGAQILGLSKGIPVAMGGADSACSALAAGVVEDGEVFETMGTSDVLAICMERPTFDARFLNRCHTFPSRWLAMGAMVAVGAAFRWARDTLGEEEKNVARLCGLDAYDLLCREAAISQPGSNGVVFLPYMSGERSPIWDPHAKGVFFGLSLSTTKNDLIRAVLEGGSYGLRQNLEAAEDLLGRKLSSIAVVGKGARNPFLASLRSEITGVEIVALSFYETATLGAAMLGGVASGAYKDCQEAVKRAAQKNGKAHRPSGEDKVIYDATYSIYKSLYPALKDSFKELRDITLMAGTRQTFESTRRQR
jgi:xylulokinase